MKAPTSINDVFFVPANKKAAQIPGKTEWETASPTSDFFFSTINEPTMAALTESRILPNTTYLTLGSLNEKKLMKLSIVYPFSENLSLANNSPASANTDNLVP